MERPTATGASDTSEVWSDAEAEKLFALEALDPISV